MMRRINLSVKILVSQVNTAVLLCEELDITFVGKILSFLNSEQRKREKQGGKNVGSFFTGAVSCSQRCNSQEWALAAGPQHLNLGCVVEEEDVQAATPPKHRMLAPYKDQLLCKLLIPQVCGKPENTGVV